MRQLLLSAAETDGIAMALACCLYGLECLKMLEVWRFGLRLECNRMDSAFEDLNIRRTGGPLKVGEMP